MEICLKTKERKSFPILKLIQTSNSSDKNRINEIFNNNITKNDKDLILELMNKYKVESYCSKILSNKYNLAKSLIKELDIDDKYIKMLLEINFFLMNRTK